MALLHLILIIIIIHFFFDSYLDWLNYRHMNPLLPAGLEGCYNPEKYRLSQLYTREGIRLSMLGSSVSFLIMVAMFLFQGFGWLDGFLRTVTVHPILLTLLFFGVLGIASEMIGMPFSIYNQFVIEKRYEFNRMTPRLFISDKLKGWAMAMLVGGIIGTLILVIYQKTGVHFWWLAWLVITVFSLFISFFYSTLIVPLFNKQTPMEEGSLRDRIEEFAAKAGFRMDKIFVIDGSRRSTKANAYFTGFGRKRRIVLYDTLIRDLTADKIVAVLAHEIGHYRLGHVWKNVLISIVQTGLLLFLFSVVAQSERIAEAMGAGENSFHLAALVFGVLYSPASIVISLVINALSRRFEYAADRFASAHGLGDALSEALVDLNQKNLGNLTPHPAYEFIHYSHPSLIKRLKALAINS